jgi:hypothetical protein
MVSDASDFLDSIAHLLSRDEKKYIEHSIHSRALPTPKLLVKDHKPPKGGDLPTRLIIPASNFTSAFPKMGGYLAIKRIFDDNKVPYATKTIVQVSDLKERLETLGLISSNCTIVSIDAQDYYPSVHFKLIRKAVQYYSQTLPNDLQDTVEDCLETVRFGMKSTLFTFQDQFYEYDGEENIDDGGLTIGGYEAAWLADVVGAYILDNTQHLYEETILEGFYRDDGFAHFSGLWSYHRLALWRTRFQDAVGTLAEGSYLQYTLSIWLDKCQ